MAITSAICCVIVVYNEKYNDTKSFKSIVPIVNSLRNVDFHVIIYDNSKEAQNVESKYGIKNFTYIHDPRNKGVIEAYQYASKYCKNNNIVWLFRLDQDSTFKKDLFENFFEVLEMKDKYAVIIPRISSNDKIISPSFIRKGGLYKPIPQNLHGVFYSPITYINSMSFVNISDFYVYQALMSASFKLDLSDHEFALKVPCNLVYVMESEVQHELSVLNIRSMSKTRYASLINNEIFFIHSTQDFSGRLIFYIRLCLRIIKLVLNGRFDLILAIFKSVLNRDE